MRTTSFLLGLLALNALPAQQAGKPSWQSPPKLVVGIVVDQMRVDYIYRYWNNFREGGFRRLVNEGSFQRDAHYTYMPTVTGPGHASIYTGTTPALHGIIENERYDARTRRSVYCVEDTAVRGLGSASPGGRRSPVQLRAGTLADELELRFDGASHTVGVALKDRSAILPIGRTGDLACWFVGGNEGRAVTSTWYRQDTPAWLQSFNELDLAGKYLKRTWSLLLPAERYHRLVPDDNPYEIPLARGLSPTLPVDLDSLRRAGATLDLLTYTPWGNTWTTDLALAALDGEDMGRDSITDLLAVSYSSPDILGHRMGPRAVELEDMYLRLDQELARLLNELDKRVGKGRYTVFLTADHGAVDVPQLLKDRKASAGYVDMYAVAKDVERELPALVSGGQLMLDTVVDGHVHIGGGPASLRLFAQRLMEHPAVAIAITREDLMAGGGRHPLLGMLANGFSPVMSGDVLYALRPGYFEAVPGLAGRGTTHGSGWNYDTHVPVILYGQGVRPGEVIERTSITDIVPTVCTIVGMSLPDAATGRAVQRAVQER
ncbi:MAG: alkaline phosphatase family protein [Flavobacteriales bacterium]|nr:alkaline phosphatase family protein [Flavobacteriales bacterium]